MRLVADAGLWSTGPPAAPVPLVAVLEVSGAVLSWTVDEEAGPAAVTFTDVARADWLWRVVGEAGHSALAAAVTGRLPEAAQTIDLDGVGLLAGSFDHLRRLALGHWMRRWWPASHRDGIAVLDPAVLDAEIAVLTAAAQDFFADRTFDSEVTELLGPHAGALNDLVRAGDPRVIELVRAASELSDDVGIVLAEPALTPPRRDDYALAAGAQREQRRVAAVAGGTSSLAWAAVPPAVFDAAEDTIDWAVEAGAETTATVAVALLGGGSPAGIPVRLRARTFEGAGVLDERGRSTFALVDEQGRPVAEPAVWNQDWRATAVRVGADTEESPQTRRRVREFARARLGAPGGDAFLAEILAAESDY